MGEKGWRCGRPPWGVISRFLSVCLSLSVWKAHAPCSKNLSKTEQNQKENTTLGPAGGVVVKALDTPIWLTTVRVLNLVACFSLSLSLSLVKLK